MTTAACDRRSFLSLAGLNRSTGGVLGALVPDVGTAGVNRTHQQMCVARRAMACDFSLQFAAGVPSAVEAGCAALDEIERLDRKLSVYIGDSDVSTINRHAHEAPVAVDPELFELLSTAMRLTEATDGAFDMATGALIKAWGFFRGPPQVPSADALNAARAQSGANQIVLDADERRVAYRRAGVEINLGSIGKGYAIDRAVAVAVEEFGVTSVLMQGGRSSLKAVGGPEGAGPGEPGWRVAIGDPYDSSRTVATVELKNRALGTSGSAEQFFVAAGRRYGHVLDPRTGQPADALASASAVAPTAAGADALATAFFVMGLEATRRYCAAHPEVGAVLVTRRTTRNEANVIPIGLTNREFRLGSASDGRAGSRDDPA